MTPPFNYNLTICWNNKHVSITMILAFAHVLWLEMVSSVLTAGGGTLTEFKYQSNSPT